MEPNAEMEPLSDWRLPRGNSAVPSGNSMWQARTLSSQGGAVLNPWYWATHGDRRGLTATVTPQTPSIGIPWAGSVHDAVPMPGQASTLGVGGGPAEHEVALAGRTPIFADTPVPPLTGDG